MVAELQAELANHPLNDAYRARLEQQIAAIQSQLELHASAFDDLAPGLGYVAAADTTGHVVPPEGADTNGGTMGSRPGQAHGTAPLTNTLGGAPVPPPAGRSAPAHAALVRRRGSDSVPLATGDRRPGWTVHDEARFRWGDHVTPPDGYHWNSDGTGTPFLVRDATTDGGGNAVPERALDPAAAARGETNPDLLFPVRPDTVVPAQFHPEANGAFADPDFTPSADARTRMDQLAAQRRGAVVSRTNAEGRIARLANELGLSPADLDALNGSGAAAVVQRLREAGGDAARQAKVDELATATGALSTARLDVTRASEQIGNQMALDYMRQSHSDARRVFPSDADLAAPGRPGEFDFIYIVGQPPNHSVIVVEAKGGSSRLGTRSAGAQGDVQQGSAPYLDSVARAMQGSATGDLRAALDGILDRRATGTEVHYVLVEAPLTDTVSTPGTGTASATATGGNPREGRVREFRL